MQFKNQKIFYFFVFLVATIAGNNYANDNNKNAKSDIGFYVAPTAWVSSAILNRLAKNRQVPFAQTDNSHLKSYRFILKNTKRIARFVSIFELGMFTCYHLVCDKLEDELKKFKEENAKKLNQIEMDIKNYKEKH